MRIHHADSASLPAVISGLGLIAMLLMLLAATYLLPSEPQEDAPAPSAIGILHS